MFKLLRRRPAEGPAHVRRFRGAPGVVSARHGSRTVLLDPRRGEYFGVDAVGAEIWGVIAEGATLDEVVAALERLYDAPREQLEQDAASFIELLRRRHLVRYA